MFANNFSSNKSMIPYYGRHGTNQFIRELLIRLRFKLMLIRWVPFHAEPYCGKDTDLPEAGLEEGSDVALGMIEKCHITKGSRVAMDNFFSMLPFLDQVTDRGMYNVGTIRENRKQGAPQKKKTALQKETRGTSDYTSDGNNLVAAWTDNKFVTFTNNYLLLNPVSSTKSWSKAEKKHVVVPTPNPFKEYNANMEGIDLFDEFLSTYCVRIRSKKCWWPFFAWLTNATVVNT